MSQPIAVEISDKIAKITFQSNEQNTFDPQFCHLLSDEINKLKEEQNVRAVILTGSGGFFSNGFNPNNFVEKSKDEISSLIAPAFNLCYEIMTHPLPFASCMNGHAMGFGAILSLYTDYRYMLEKGGRFGFPEILIGLPIPLAPAIKLQDICGSITARDMVFSGKAFKATEALENKLIDKYFIDEEQMLSFTRKALSKLFKFPRITVSINKKAVNYRYLDSLRVAIDKDIENASAVISSAEGQEGLSALKAGRRPNFSEFS